MIVSAALILIARLAPSQETGGKGGESTGKEAAGCEKPLRNLFVEGEEYRTPRAGEGFRANVFGRDVTVEPRDRRKVTAWDLGFATFPPGVTGSEVLPFGAVYLWRRPDEGTYFRGVLVGLYDKVVFAKSAEKTRPMEGLLTFENLTIPFGRAENVDGVYQDDEELLWGEVRGGVGVGYRRSLDYEGADGDQNMAALSLTFEPGYLYFDDSKKTAEDFEVPQDTFEGRLHLKGRLDHMERNLLELCHKGFAIGGDLVLGSRANWEAWGSGGRQEASGGRDFLSFSGYLVGASSVPFLGSERHKLVGRIHGGTGENLDRFSGFRLGGGPYGEEFEELYRPIVPGALVDEFIASHYLVALGEYRFEPIFFTYLSLRSSVTYMERRRLGGDSDERSDDLLSSVGFRVTTGFIFKTLLQIDYNYSFGVIRRGDYGGHEIVVHLSGEF